MVRDVDPRSGGGLRDEAQRDAGTRLRGRPRRPSARPSDRCLQARASRGQRVLPEHRGDPAAGDADARRRGAHRVDEHGNGGDEGRRVSVDRVRGHGRRRGDASSLRLVAELVRAGAGTGARAEATAVPRGLPRSTAAGARLDARRRRTRAAPWLARRWRRALRAAAEHRDRRRLGPRRSARGVRGRARSSRREGPAAVVVGNARGGEGAW